MVKSGIVCETDLTPFFTDKLKREQKIEKARTTEREDGKKTIEIMFNDAVPQVERNIMIIAIGENLVNMCREAEQDREENKELLAFMDGAAVQEWRET